MNSPFLLAAAAAALLSLPGLRLAYLFDDYDFLARTQVFHSGLFVPDPAIIFYRPVSRELYFGLLNWLSPGDPLAGHLLNCLLVASAVFMAATFAARIAGFKAGVITGLLLASFGQWPVLGAWVSGIQDLLAINFALLALHLELRGRTAASLVALACAILSKETAVAAAPALVALRWLRFPRPGPVFPQLFRVAALLGTWALFHPGLRVLLARGGEHWSGSYIGMDNPHRWMAVLKSVPVLSNLPLGFPTQWPEDLAWAVALAALPFLATLWTLPPRGEGLAGREESSTRIREDRIVGFGLLFALPPLLATCLFVHAWAPYYLCFPAVGLSIALGRILATVPYRFCVGCVAVYLVLGIWSRGAEIKPGMLSEVGLARAGKGLRQVERDFKLLAPLLPRWSTVYVTTMATSPHTVYTHIHHFQALRIWYADPTIHTLRPELRVISGGPEFLFAIDPKLNVFQIDVQSLAVQSSGPPVDRMHYRSVVRSYAFGLAGGGEVGRAVEVLLKIDPPGSESAATNRRIAAALLLLRGETRPAIELLRGIPDLPPSEAFEKVGMLLTVPTRGIALEDPLLRVFGLSPEDPEVIRALLRALLGLGHYGVSQRLAVRLLALKPGDQEATQALAQIKSIPVSADQVTQETRRLKFPGE